MNLGERKAAGNASTLTAAAVFATISHGILFILFGISSCSGPQRFASTTVPGKQMDPAGCTAPQGVRLCVSDRAAAAATRDTFAAKLRTRARRNCVGCAFRRRGAHSLTRTV